MKKIQTHTDLLRYCSGFYLIIEFPENIDDFTYEDMLEYVTSHAVFNDPTITSAQYLEEIYNMAATLQRDFKPVPNKQLEMEF